VLLAVVGVRTIFTIGDEFLDSGPKPLEGVALAGRCGIDNSISRTLADLCGESGRFGGADQPAVDA
jgi:hypothetical protein